MIFCNRDDCRFCAIDNELARGGVMVCTVEPIMIGVESLKPWMLKCNSYKYRPAGQQIRPVVPVDFDGLYPGQIKPPRDFSDYDPDEKFMGSGEDRECDT